MARTLGVRLARLGALVALLSLAGAAHAAPDLVVDLLPSASPVLPGAALTYEVRVHNAGTTAFSGPITATHTFGPGLTPGASTCPAWSSPTCTLPGPLAAGATTSYRLEVTAPTGLTTLRADLALNGGLACAGELTCANNFDGASTHVFGNQCADHRVDLVLLDDTLTLTRSGDTCDFSPDFPNNPCEVALTSMGDGSSEVLVLEVRKVGKWRFTIDAGHQFMLTTACPDVPAGGPTQRSGNACLRNLGAGGLDDSTESIYLPEPGRYYLQITSYPDAPTPAGCGPYTLSIDYDSGDGTGEQVQCLGGFIEGDPLDVCVDQQLSMQVYHMGRPLAFGSSKAGTQGAPNDYQGRGGADIAIDVWAQNTLGQACVVAPQMNLNSNSSRLIAGPKWGVNPSTGGAASLVTSGAGTALDPWRVIVDQSQVCASNQPALLATQTVSYVEGADHVDVTLEVCGDLTHQGGLDVTGAPMRTGDLAGSPVVFFCGVDQWEDATKNGNPSSDYDGLDPRTATYLQVDNLSDVTGTPAFDYPFGNPSTYSSTVQRLIAVDRAVSCLRQDTKTTNDWAHLRTPYGGDGCAMANGVIDSTQDQVGILQLGAGKGTAATVGKLLLYEEGVGFTDRTAAASTTTTADISNPLPAQAAVGDCVYFGRTGGGFEYLRVDLADEGKSPATFASVCTNDGAFDDETGDAACRLSSCSGSPTMEFVLNVSSAGVGTLGYGIYFGHTTPFRSVDYELLTATGWGGTVTWQYWNGATWANLTNVVDGTNGFKVAGIRSITFDLPGDWQKAVRPAPLTTACNATDAYYVRGVVTAVGAGGTGVDGIGQRAWPGPSGGESTFDGTLAWQYSKAGGWGTLTDLVDRTESFTESGPADAFVLHVPRIVSYRYPADWAAATVSGTAAHWVRACVTSVTSGGGGLWDAVEMVTQTSATLVGQTTFFGADNCARATCRLAASTQRGADVSISKTVGASSARVGDELTYTLNVRNDGPEPAPEVLVTDTLPLGLTPTGPISVMYSDDLVLTTCEQEYLDPATNTLSCVLRNLLDPGDEATLTLVVTIGPEAAQHLVGGAFTNVATVDHAAPDPDPTDDAASASTPLTPPASLTLTKTTTTSAALPDDLVTYTLTVSNAAGVGEALATVVTDTLPAGLTVVSTAGDCAEPSPAYPSCSLGVIPAGATRSYTLVARVEVGAPVGTATNSATVAHESGELDPSDDTASAAIEVGDPTPPPSCEDVSCELATTWVPLVDSNNAPLGALRCRWDGVDAPVCDTDAAGELIVYPTASCEVAP